MASSDTWTEDERQDLSGRAGGGGKRIDCHGFQSDGWRARSGQIRRKTDGHSWCRSGSAWDFAKPDSGSQELALVVLVTKGLAALKLPQRNPDQNRRDRGPARSIERDQSALARTVAIRLRQEFTQFGDALGVHVRFRDSEYGGYFFHRSAHMDGASDVRMKLALHSQYSRHSHDQQLAYPRRKKRTR